MLWVLATLLGAACSTDTPVAVSVVETAPSTSTPFKDYLTKEGIYVTFSQGIGEPALLKLLEQKDLHPLRTISVHGQRITAASAHAIMTADATSDLHSLYLQESTIGDAGLKAIADAPRLAQLQHINLDKVGATAAGVAALAASPYLQPESLSIGWQAVGDAGAVALAKAKGIQTLHLESAEIGTTGMVALLQNTSAKAITFINNPGGLDTLTSISSSLQGLHFKNCRFDSADIQMLSNANAPGLTSLTISSTDLQDTDLADIAAAPWFGQLDQLVLSAQRTSPESRRAIIDAYRGSFLSIYRKDL